MSSTTVSASSEDYTVAWIAALPHERAAGEMMFDQEYEQPENFVKNANDPNRYSWGRMGKRLVVIASLRLEDTGQLPQLSQLKDCVLRSHTFVLAYW
jgi:hypothetical protein